MSILLDTQTGDRNLRDGTTPALNYTMLANGDVRVNIYAGTFAKPCVDIEGTWQLYTKVVRGGLAYRIEPFPQLYAASSNHYKLFTSKTIEAKTNDIIQVILYSPNVGDTEVTVTAEIWHVSGSLPAVAPNAVGGLPVLDANSLVNVDVERLAGVAQSLTDLKDFADTGYNPTTHKVAGVVLVDTTTTNTDMVAAAPSTADIVTAMQAAGTMLKALDDLTKAAGDGDLAAMKTIIDALPDAGALTTLQAAVDALVAPVNIDNNGIVITNEDKTP